MERFILKHRGLIIAFILLGTILFGTQIKHMGKDVSINSMLSADNPEFIYAEKMEDLFGAGDGFVIGIRFPDTVYTVKNLALVKAISDYHAIASMGWIVAVAMVTTALTSLTILPGLLAIFKPEVKSPSVMQHIFRNL